jgi:acyl-CoA synthetase (AMP-forming)/AMP-acid ligase II
MLGNMMQRPLLTQSVLQHAANRFQGTSISSRNHDGTVAHFSFTTLRERVGQLTNALEDFGLQPGDRVGTLAWNDHRHLELYYAVSGSGAICHTVNPRLAVEQIEYIIDHAGDRFLFVDRTFAPLVPQILTRCPKVEGVVFLCEPADISPEIAGGGLFYEEFLDAQSPEHEWGEFDENTASGLCYTSGTTGNPKGVLYSHRSTILHALVSSHSCGFALSHGHVVMPVVPMFHVNAWNLPYSALITGAHLVLPGAAPTGASMFALIKSERVEKIIAVPTVLQMLLDHAEKVGEDLAPLRYVITGGSSPATKLMHDLESRGIEVLHGSGMTETSSMLTMNHLDEDERQLDLDSRLEFKVKQGQAPFGMELRIVNDANEILPWDGKSSGHLEVRAPWVLERYYGADEPATVDGWFRSGDVATIDPQARMQIVDRTKDLIKSGGEWISSIDLENAAAGVASVAVVGVVAIAHPKWGERPLMVVQCKAGETVSKESVMAPLIEKFPRWWLPDEVVFIDAMPLTATGKISKLALRERFKKQYGC